MDNIQIHVTQAELDEVRKSEAACLCIYENPDGSQYAVVLEHGSYEEMQYEAGLRELVINFDGGPKAVSKDCVYVRDVLGSHESN